MATIEKRLDALEQALNVAEGDVYVLQGLGEDGKVQYMLSGGVFVDTLPDNAVIVKVLGVDLTLI